jgi:hypothetical protein
MRNPFRSESGTLRFAVTVAVVAVLIVGAALLNTWLGVAAGALAVVGLVGWLVQEPVPGAADTPPRLASGTPPGTRRVLVVAPPGTTSVSAPDVTEAVVVVPALASKVEALTGDVDDRRAEAQQTASRLAAQLPNARGEVGADDPVLAVEDALRQFGADEIVVVGHGDVLDQIRERVALPVSRA